MPKRERFGSVSFSNSNRLPKISPPASTASPVTFPPGRARLATSPALTGSRPVVMTIGMVVVAFMAATVIGLIPVTNDVHAEPDQVCGKRRQPFHLAVGEAVLDDDILANAVAEAPQALFERFNEMERLLPGRDRQVSDPVDPPCRLLRTRGQRPRRRRAAEKRDELAPSHVPPIPKA